MLTEAHKKRLMEAEFFVNGFMKDRIFLPSNTLSGCLKVKKLFPFNLFNFQYARFPAQPHDPPSV